MDIHTNNSISINLINPRGIGQPRMTVVQGKNGVWISKCSVITGPEAVKLYTDIEKMIFEAGNKKRGTV